MNSNPKLKKRLITILGTIALFIIVCTAVNFAFGAKIADLEEPTEETKVVEPEKSEQLNDEDAASQERSEEPSQPQQISDEAVSSDEDTLPEKDASADSVKTNGEDEENFPSQPEVEVGETGQRQEDHAVSDEPEKALLKQKIITETAEPKEEKTTDLSSSPEEIKKQEDVPKSVKASAKKRVGSVKAKRKPAEQYVTIDFDNVDITVFIKFISELTGKNFIIDDRVRGKATIISPKKIPLKDVYKVFLSVLEVNGFATVPVGDMVKIVPAVTAREKSLETEFKKDINYPDDRMVTHIIPLERANPDEIKRVIDPIVPKTGSVLSYPPAGMLVITDYLSNIKRVQDIINALDVEGAGDQISYIPLHNASASEVAKSLSAIYQQRRPATAPIRIVPDTRTNSIILLASVAETESLRRLIELMDKDLPREESNVQVYRLQNSVAEDLAKVLNSIVKEGSSGAAGSSKTPAPVVSKNVQVVPDKATNTLVIMAEREDYKVLEGIIRQLDVPRPMVYIEALIMEVKTNKDFHLGVEWRGLLDTGNVSGEPTAAFIGSGGAGTASTGPGGYNILKDTMTAFPSGFSMGVIAKAITIGGIIFPDIGAVIQAYKTDSDVSILSTPQIMTLNNEEAEINVGENVPYVTRRETTDADLDYSQYEYRDVGVILKITPNINQENFIRLKISQEVTKVISIGSDENASTPTTLKRTVKTAVVVKDKETIVIGGLIGDSTEDNNYRVPFLGDIPLLGWLFKTRGRTREKTNLYVFITPHIVRTQQDANALYKKKRESMGTVEEGVIKLDDKKPQEKPQNQLKPSEDITPEES